MSDHHAPARLLVLEDERAVAETMVLIAEEAGFEVRVAPDPETFLALCSSWRPSHVSIDLHLPHADGIAVLRHLATRAFGGQVIVASGLDRRVLEAAQRSAAEHGLALVGTLPKPFTADALRALLWAPPTGQPSDADGTPIAPWPVDADRIRAALRDGSMTTVYQPKVRCLDGTVVGLETLARWHLPEGGVLLPEAFLPVAEAEGVVDELTEVLFSAALAFLAGSFPDDPMTLSFNVSARSLDDVSFADRLAAIARSVGIQPSRVVIEVTETSASADRITALDVLTRARIMGLGLALDDFGTGHSTLVQLARQPFSELKIDKGFVGTALASNESRTITQAMIQLAHNLGLESTAEGVEDAATLELLRDQGCDNAQGNWIATPMPGARAAAWVRDRRAGGRGSVAAP